MHAVLPLQPYFNSDFKTGEARWRRQGGSAAEPLQVPNQCAEEDLTAEEGHSNFSNKEPACQGHMPLSSVSSQLRTEGVVGGHQKAGGGGFIPAMLHLGRGAADHSETLVWRMGRFGLTY